MNQTLSICVAVGLLLGSTDNLRASDPREFKAQRVEQAPRIDGKLDEEVWQNASEKIQFTQFAPDNGKPSAFYTTVHLIYTDQGIYVGARLHDPQPELILKEFGQRDDDDRNADYFAVLLDTYNSGLNAFAFGVSAAGVQIDTYFNSDEDDSSWDAVWNSAVEITEDGWTVEMEIPYFALRFPKQAVQTWGLNFYRNVKRNQEESYWNRVDNAIQGIVNQSGKLHGLKNIQPPLRLSFYPYVSTIYTHDGNTGKGVHSFAGGIDLKYGINESFTLDLSLIPDFTQVQSDNIVYNISAYEVRFNENRPFFTEGTELFNKANLFYSRRVGQSFGSPEYDEEKEEVLSSPTGANLINAIKVSGRNKKGLGLGLFNGITDKTFARIRNVETGAIREAQVDPLTNFNVAVIDQNLKNNSNINFTNTNVIRADGGRDANVSGLNLNLRDKKNIYQLTASGSYSAIWEGAENQTFSDGYKYYLELAKVSGTWQYGLSRNVESDTYNPNDLGYLQAPNEISYFGYLRYSILKPVGILNRMSVSTNVFYQRLYKPNEFASFNTFFNAFAQLKNFWSVGFNSGIRPVEGFDYFEPRTSGWKFLQPENFNFNFWMESDSRKPLQINAFTGRWYRPEWDQQFWWGGFFLRYRVNNKLSLTAEVSTDQGDSRGYATKLYTQESELDEIIFGHRDMLTMENVFGVNYTFNNKMGLRLRLRHYWSKIKYEKFFSLGQEDGDLYPTTYTGLDSSNQPLHDANFNAINLDLVYFWQIAPGSFVNVVWKDAIQSFSRDTTPNYFENIRDSAQSPQLNSISVRLTYFLDYLTVKNSLRGKR